MQFIEKTSFNVRSLIFPMIHVGSSEFYGDLILAEGVKSRKARSITLSYRIVKHIRRMELITQREGMRVESCAGSFSMRILMVQFLMGVGHLSQYS
jgi:hypothetical protein